MYTKNLTVREMYASIGDTNYIVELFQKGLEINNDRLAVSAMEELLRRGDTDFIAKGLNHAFEQGQLTPKSTLVTLIANSLMDGAREVDPILQRYGKGLLRGELMGPYQWIANHADQFRKVPKCGVVKNAQPWASAQIWGKSDIS